MISLYGRQWLTSQFPTATAMPPTPPPSIALAVWFQFAEFARSGVARIASCPAPITAPKRLARGRRAQLRAIQPSERDGLREDASAKRL
jgi:hypothetical protein